MDDVLAPAGLDIAGLQLLSWAGAVVKHALFVIELPDLGGAEALNKLRVTAEAAMASEGH